LSRHFIAPALFAACVFAAAAPAAATDKADAVALVTRYFATGDAALCAPGTQIVDDFAPFVWSGPKACATWAADWGAFQKANKFVGTGLKLGTATTVKIVGATAYVVVPGTITATAEGKPVVVKGVVAAALKKAKAGWLLTGWSWADQ
jgi:hypothetical protein